MAHNQMKTDKEHVRDILARQVKDVTQGVDPQCTLERLREIRAELTRKGVKFPPIKKVKKHTAWWYRDNAKALAEITQ